MVDAVVKFALAAVQSPSLLALALLLVFAALLLVGFLMVRMMRNLAVHSNRLHDDLKDFKIGFTTASGVHTQVLMQIRDLLLKEAKDQVGRPIILSLAETPGQVSRIEHTVERLAETVSGMCERLERMERSELSGRRFVASG